MKNVMFILFAIMSVTTNAGAGDLSGSSYQVGQVRVLTNLWLGQIVDIRRVEIATETTTSQTGGALIGAAAGAALGNQIGGGNGRTLAQLALGILGAGVGQAVDEGISRREAVEIIIALDDGRAVSTTQQLDSDAARMRVGDRVRIIDGGNGGVRVARMGGAYQGQNSGGYANAASFQPKQ